MRGSFDHVADRLHARLHDAFLEVGGNQAQALQRHLELAVVLAAHHLQKLVAGQHQFADQRHQVFEQADADPDRLRRDRGFLGPFRFLAQPGARTLAHRGAGAGSPVLALVDFLGAADGFRGRLGCRLLGRGRLGRFGLAFGFHRRAQRLIRGRLDAGRLGRRDFLQQFRRHREADVRGCRGAGGFLFLLLLGLFLGRSRNGSCRRPAFRRGVQQLDQIAVLAFGLGAGFLEDTQQFLDAIDRGEDERHRIRRHFQSAVPELAQHVLRRVGDRFQPGQAEEAARALDRVNQPENVLQDCRIRRIPLELYQFNVQDRQILGRLRQKIRQ